ncbi:hypothetical protein ABFC02_08005 [Klebsiella variicola]|uniref:hypothetical protein n=1 Tax=Klebsiella variicola TaxID=244366 RepID=UPI001E397940|nr:hypothetical protein [Klebsiella variicola]
MFSLWVKWPEKAVSESSHELAQLSFLVQVEKAACVTFPLCAVKVTHGSGAVLENLLLVQFYGHAAAKPTAMQAAARKGKRRWLSADTGYPGEFRRGTDSDQQAGAVKGHIE